AAGKIRIKPDSPYIKQMKRKAGLVYKDCLLKRDFCYLTEVMNQHCISASDIEMLPLPPGLFFLYYPLHFILATVRWYNRNRKTIENNVV
ncbi:MAG: hypothetical protein PHV82_19220, partial [Victivallaceae bacterium]|nr:hypothetical protein [Victivallaceae bacterium]